MSVGLRRACVHLGEFHPRLSAIDLSYSNHSHLAAQLWHHLLKLDITLHCAEQGREAPGNVRQRHSGLAIVSSDVCGVTRVYPPSIFRSRKLRLATLIVGLQGFYFIPGPRNPTIKVAKRYFGDHFRVHLVRTSKNTRSISVTHERKWRFAQ